MIFVVSTVTAQQKATLFTPKIVAYSPPLIFIYSTEFNNSRHYSASTGFRINVPAKNITKILMPDITPFCVITADYYTRNFGFFCKKELEFEKKTKIPLRFRLGSLRYVDHLEGKLNAGLLTGQ